MLLVIDNYDSFTYNLYQYLGELGADLRVYRNDKVTIEQIEEEAPRGIVISPGPGRPEDGGISLEVVTHFASRLPIIGVCLGHQCIGQGYGAKIVGAERIMHGKTSWIHHQGRGLFEEVENPFEATRYHSLLIKPSSLPSEFDITAHTDEGEIMGIQHKQFPTYGVQFHPESILTGVGKQILSNFIKRCSIQAEQS